MKIVKPKLNLLYFKNLLDRCLVRFFRDNNHLFTKNETLGYVFSGTASKTALTGMFMEYMCDELAGHVVEYSDSNPEFFFIIGSCAPASNILLEFDRDLAKGRVGKLIEKAPDMRYYMKESDLRLDMRLFNQVFEDVFVKNMKRKPRRNVFFIRHNSVDCWFMYKMFKERYGDMAVNLHKKRMMGEDRCICSANEVIDAKCRRKTEILKNPGLDAVKDEIFRFVDKCMEDV